MDYKKIIMVKVLFSTVVGGSAWAQTTYNVVNGTTTWTGDVSITGVSSGWPNSGIRGEGGITGIINTNGNINSSINESGVFISGGTSVTINSSDPTKNFTVNNNTWEGFLVESGSDLTINDMNVSANNNANNGLRAQDGEVNIIGATTVEFNNNGSQGIFASNGSVSIGGTGGSSLLTANDNNPSGGWGGGIWSENNATIHIDNMNVEVIGNGLSGIMARNGDVTITGDGNQTLTVTGNGVGSLDGGVIVTQGGHLNVSGMNVQIDGNGRYGLQASVGGVATITGSSNGQNNLTADGNEYAGLVSMNSDSVLTIVDMDVQANNNGSYGVQVSDNAVATITGSNAVQNILTANNNAGTGLESIGGSTLTITNMEVNASDNGNYGVAAFNNDSVLNIIGSSGNPLLTVSGNNSSGSWGGGIWSEGGATINIEGMKIEVDSNGLAGIMVRSGDITIAGDGTQYLAVTNNGVNSADGGVIVALGGDLSVSGMEVQIDGNGKYGLQVSTAGVATITGSNSVQNSLTADNNQYAGLASMDTDSVLTIINMDVQANDNGSSTGAYGILTQNGGKTIIAGNVSNPNTFTVSASSNKNNTTSWTEGAGLAAQGVSGTSASTMTIQNMNVEANDNGQYGLSATDGGVINIIGDGSYTLEALRNVTSTANPWADGAGIYADGSNSANPAMKSTITIVGMNINVSENDFHGIRATEGGVINIAGTNNNKLEVTANNNSDGSTGNGIVADFVDSDGSKSAVIIQDMDVFVEDQAYQGIAALNGGLVNITSTSSTNSLEIYNTRMTTNIGQDLGKGIHAKEADSGTGAVATVVIKDMNIISNDNELEGLVAADSGVIYIESSSGNNKLTANENRNYTVTTPGNWTYGAGLLAHGISASAPGQQASIIIKNMNVEANDNGMYGIYVRDGGLISITGDGSHTLDVIGNQTSLNNEGIGISVADVSNGIRSQLDIVDMNIVIDSNPDAGIKASGGSLVNVISNAGTNTLKANNNDNHGAQFNEGAGIWAFGTDGAATPTASTINLIGLDIEAKNNGSYGVLSEGGYINIQGDGTHKLDLDGNGRYGLLAKDGGSADITGMVVSGDSLDHAFVGIERDGLIRFANSTITTDTDTLFYTWSDSSTQTGQFILDNSVAIGNGTKLAYFNSHNGVLEATDSYLENAIVTDTGAGITSTVSLDDSTWVMKSSSNITNLTTTSDSIIDMRGDSGYNTLTLSRLTSNDSTYLINTYFDFPGLSTDKIIVDGDDATGTNNILKVYSTGYAAGTSVINGYGIQVVNLDNATNKSVDFTLFGGVVDSGAYEYELYRAVDDNYYLQTNYRATTTAKTIINIPAIHLSIVKTGLNEFRHRITELREYDVFHPNELWVRTYGKRLRVNDTIDSRMSLYGVEIGYDKEVYGNDDNKYYAGVMAGYIYTGNIRHHNSGYPDGTARANAPSVGLYGVWDNSDGWYSYATLRYFWSRMRAENYTSSGELISYRPNRDFITASVELGKQFEYIRDEDSKWIIEPKGELRYAYAGSRNFRTNMGYKIHYGISKSFTTRAALLIGYNHRSESGSIYEPFVEVGVSREWLGDTDVSYAGGIFSSNQKGTDYDIAVGLRAKINESWSFIGNLGYETGSVHKGFGAQLGVRYSWD
ncbi:autotransporter outer membrane beta-barrel domain-containing protein [Saezia sanguinis]|uniref:autotransporter outer membrane beta-barrel domain-containing protein n=1 Tax=Saezia sanguinis TaxID=1965230 RepID=UPI0030287C82